MRPDRHAVIPLLALLVFLNGSLCFCEGHDADAHGHSTGLSDMDESGPASDEHAPEEDDCVQMDVLGIRERGTDGEAPTRGGFPAAIVVQARESALDPAGAPAGEAGRAPVHAPPRFLTHCSLLC